MKVRCNRWKRCNDQMCPHWPEHEQQTCYVKQFCIETGWLVKCKEVKTKGEKR